MKSSIGSSDFLKEISSLSHSVVFLYFFALITEESFLISLFYSLKLSNGYVFPFLLCLLLLFFSQLFLRPPQTTSFRFCIFFLRMILITASCTVSWTSIYSSSGTLFISSNPLNLFVTLGGGILLFIICPSCACMQLFLVLYGFFVFCAQDAFVQVQSSAVGGAGPRFQPFSDWCETLFQ